MEDCVQLGALPDTAGIVVIVVEDDGLFVVLADSEYEDEPAVFLSDNPVIAKILKVWSVGRRSWETQQIIGVMPHLQPVLATLLGELQQSGLIQENDTAPATVKRVRNDLAKQVNRQAERMQRGNSTLPVTIEQSTIETVELSWSPTELGETVLAFYAEAGAEHSQDPGGNPGQGPGD